MDHSLDAMKYAVEAPRGSTPETYVASTVNRLAFLEERLVSANNDLEKIITRLYGPSPKNPQTSSNDKPFGDVEAMSLQINSLETVIDFVFENVRRLQDL